MARIEPGRDPQMVKRTNALNLLFAVSSIGLLVTLALMIWKDYDRDWKRYQIGFNRLEVARTEQQIQKAESDVDAQKRQQLEAQLQKGREEVAQNRAALKEAQAKRDAIEARWYAADQNFRFTKARIDVARYDYDEAVNSGHDSTGAKKNLDDLIEQWNGQRRILEEVVASRTAAQEQLDGLRADQIAAEKGLQDLLSERDRLETRLEEIQPGIVWFLRNLPILDMANPSLKVQQVMPANLIDDVIFTGTQKVDRCTTCHLGITRRGFEDAPQPFTTHPNLDLYLEGPHPIEKVGCTTCHHGRGRGTSFQKAAHTPSTKDQEEAWGRYTGSAEYHPIHDWDTPMLTAGHTESQCLKCHRDEVEIPKADKLNAGVRMVEKYGCYGCHKIKGWERIRKPAPDLTKITSKTSEDWIIRWIQEPLAFRPARMPQVWGVRIDETPDQLKRNDAEMNAVAAYILDQSAKVDYPKPPAGDLQRGRDLFESVGCLGCHRVGEDKRGVEGLSAASFRTHGPNLAGSGSKLDAGWLYAWIQDPRSYWHETRMPRLRLTPGEAGDITAYLMSLKNDEFMARPRPVTDPAVRDQIIRENLLEQNTLDQAEAKLAAMGEQEKQLFLGQRTIARYGCFGCHVIKGFETANPIGVELTEEGSKLVERLDFGFEHETIPHTLPAWLHRKLMEPRVFDRNKEKNPADWLRMPKFHFTDEEADALVTAILSFNKEKVPEAAVKQLDADDRHVQAGQRLVRELNCRGCHQLGDYGGSVQAVIADQLKQSGGDAFQAVALAPPLLYNAHEKIGEGSRVRTPWLHDFLRDPSHESLPWLSIRIPAFDFT